MKDQHVTLKQLQEARDMLVESEKLAAIGILSAGVAHEILNPVNIIFMRLQLLENSSPLTEDLKDLIAVCRPQIDRIVKIAKDLSQFSRVYKPELALGDVNRVIEQVLNIYAPRFLVEKIIVKFKFDYNLPQVMLDENKFGQVIMSMVNNAADAMEGKAEKILEVRTFLKITDRGNNVRIVISDRGCGVPDSNAPHLFEPFFTTKEAGKGSGLGLSLSYGIVKDHGGSIGVVNNRWGGADFHVELPVPKIKACL